jgi:hypothetical protein
MLRSPHCLDNRLTDGGKVVSPTHPPHFTPQKHYYFYVSSTLSKSQGLVWPERFHKFKTSTKSPKRCPQGAHLLLTFHWPCEVHLWSASSHSVWQYWFQEHGNPLSLSDSPLHTSRPLASIISGDVIWEAIA